MVTKGILYSKYSSTTIGIIYKTLRVFFSLIKILVGIDGLIIGRHRQTN